METVKGLSLGPDLPCISFKFVVFAGEDECGNGNAKVGWRSVDVPRDYGSVEKARNLYALQSACGESE